jgi:hypothetical protein
MAVNRQALHDAKSERSSGRMSGVGPGGTAFYRAAEVARMLRCSEWWVKEQARCRRIPYSWIGGSYLFTDEHIAHIVRLFEVRPVEADVPIPPTRRTRKVDRGSGPPARLVAHVPRRARALRGDEAV